MKGKQFETWLKKQDRKSLEFIINTRLNVNDKDWILTHGAYKGWDNK